MKLEQLLEIFYTEPSISRDAAHRERIDGIVTGNGDDAHAVGHNRVLALPHDAETRLLQSLDCVKMINARNLRHTLKPQPPLHGLPDLAPTHSRQRDTRR